MKNSLNKSLLTAVVVAVLSFVCAFVSFGYANGKTANADTTITIPTTEEYTTAGKTDFYLYNGAAVRVESSGISFMSYVTKDYHNEITGNGTKSVTYFATANAVGKKAMALEFPIQPSFDQTETFELKTYINFKSLESDSAAAISAYAQDFATSSFARVDNGDGTYAYYKAYSEANDGTNDIVRSMRAVGNVAILNFTDDDSDGADDEFGYALSDVEKYVGTATRSTDITAYSLGNGKMAFKMPGLTNTEDTVSVYVGAEKHTASYDATRNVYTIASGAPVDDNVSIFVGTNNDVYSTKVAEATEITTEAQLSAISAGTSDNPLTTTGNYVLGADITLSAAHASYATFTGIFDGLGHTITGAISGHSGSYNGLFRYADGEVTVKNLNIKATAINNNGSAVIGWVNDAAIVNLENIVVDLAANSAGGASLVNVNKNIVNIKDTVVFIRSMKSQETGGNGAKLVWNNGYNAVNCDNVHVAFCSTSDSVNVTRYTSLDSKLHGTVDSYRYFGGFYNALNAEEITLPAEVVNGIEAVQTDVYLVDGSNVMSTIQGLTSGYVVLTEDVALTATWADNTANEKSNFTFDGAGYKISNITFNAGDYEGFIARTRTGNVNIVNADLYFAAFNYNHQALIGQNRAPLLVYNSLLTYEQISGNGSGAISTMSDGNGDMTVKDTVIHAKKTVASSTNTGILIGGDYGNVETMTLDNVAIIDDSGVVNTLNGTTYQTPITGVEGTDYIWSKGSLEAVGDAYIADKFSDNVEKIITDEKIVVPVNQENFGVLQTALYGYYYLTGNIDIATYNTDNETTYSATQAQSDPFNGVFNGCGYTINNNTTNPVCVFNAVRGTFKNFAVKVTNAFANNSAAFAFITKGATTFKDIVVDSTATIGQYGCGSLLRSVQGETTFSNIFVNAVKTTAGTKAGILAGGQADSAKIIVEKVYFVDPTSSGIPLYGETTNGNKAYGVGGEEASTDNKDYYVFTSLEEVVDATLVTENALVIDTSLKTLLEKAGLIVALNQNNIESLMTATGGYWYLTGDVDLTDISWGPSVIFTGIFNGNNHTISNISLNKQSQKNGLFYELKSATIKNVYIDVNSTSGNYAGGIAYAIRGNTTLTNVVVDVAEMVSYAGGAIGYYQEGILYATNVLIMQGGTAKENNQGIINGYLGQKYYVSNLFILNTNTALTEDLLFGNTADTAKHGTLYNADGSAAAVKGTDYWYVTAKEDLPLSTIQATGLKDILDESFFS